MNEVERWAKQSQGARHMNVIADLAKSFMTVKMGDLDKHPFLLNVHNGTLHMIREPEKPPRIELRPHNPMDFITKVCPVDYDPEATCPVYDARFAEVQPLQENRDFLHRMIGYCATGDTSEQKLFFLYGGGRNGKSTFVDVWAHVLGMYATTIPIETFLSSNRSRDGSQATPHLARLQGVRMLRTSEAERSAVLAESLIKLVTSSEPMLVRHLNRPFFELRPQFKLIISGNYKPRINGTDDGIWRRIVLVPWLVKIDKVDPYVAETLKGEASGILNRILAGMIDWMTVGLAEPKSILEATAAYRNASDHLGRFLTECTAPAAGERVSSQSLFYLYVAWAKSTGAPVWKATGFGRAMSDRGFHSAKASNNYWLDLALTKSASDFATPATQNPSDTDHEESSDDDSPF